MFVLFYHWSVLTTLFPTPNFPDGGCVQEETLGLGQDHRVCTKECWVFCLGIYSQVPHLHSPLMSKDGYLGVGQREMSLMKACRCGINPIQIHRNTRVDPRAQPSSCWWNSSNTSPGWVLCYWLQSWRLLWLALGDPWGISVFLMRCLACSSWVFVYLISLIYRTGPGQRILVESKNDLSHIPIHWRQHPRYWSNSDVRHRKETDLENYFHWSAA